MQGWKRTCTQPTPIDGIFKTLKGTIPWLLCNHLFQTLNYSGMQILIIAKYNRKWPHTHVYTIFRCQDIFPGSSAPSPWTLALETKALLSIIKVAGWTAICPARRKAVLSIHFLEASILLMISNPRLRPPETIRQALQPSVLRQQ